MRIGQVRAAAVGAPARAALIEGADHVCTTAVDVAKVVDGLLGGLW